MKKNDGGQAFPHGNPEQGGCEGMTLRDYFAAKATKSLLLHSASDKIPDNILAKLSYQIADAMIEEREK